jgi:hypothetical protein
MEAYNYWIGDLKLLAYPTTVANSSIDRDNKNYPKARQGLNESEF